MKYQGEKLLIAIKDIERWKGQAYLEGDDVSIALESIKNVAELLTNPLQKKYCSWGVSDAEHTFNQMKHDEDMFPDVEYTDELGIEIMDLVDKRFDAEYGVTWDSIRYAIEEILEES